MVQRAHTTSAEAKQSPIQLMVASGPEQIAAVQNLCVCFVQFLWPEYLSQRISDRIKNCFCCQGRHTARSRVPNPAFILHSSCIPGTHKVNENLRCRVSTGPGTSFKYFKECSWIFTVDVMFSSPSIWINNGPEQQELISYSYMLIAGCWIAGISS